MPPMDKSTHDDVAPQPKDKRDSIVELEDLCRDHGLGVLKMRQVTNTGFVEMRQATQTPGRSDRTSPRSD